MKKVYVRSIYGILQNNVYLSTKEEYETCMNALLSAAVWAGKIDRKNAEFLLDDNKANCIIYE